MTKHHRPSVVADSHDEAIKSAWLEILPANDSSMVLSSAVQALYRVAVHLKKDMSRCWCTLPPEIVALVDPSIVGEALAMEHRKIFDSLVAKISMEMILPPSWRGLPQLLRSCSSDQSSSSPLLLQKISDEGVLRAYFRSRIRIHAEMYRKRRHEDRNWYISSPYGTPFKSEEKKILLEELRLMSIEGSFSENNLLFWVGSAPPSTNRGKREREDAVRVKLLPPPPPPPPPQRQPFQPNELCELLCNRFVASPRWQKITVSTDAVLSSPNVVKQLQQWWPHQVRPSLVSKEAGRRDAHVNNILSGGALLSLDKRELDSLGGGTHRSVVPFMTASSDMVAFTDPQRMYARTSSGATTAQHSVGVRASSATAAAKTAPNDIRPLAAAAGGGGGGYNGGSTASNCLVSAGWSMKFVPQRACFVLFDHIERKAYLDTNARLIKTDGATPLCVKNIAEDNGLDTKAKPDSPFSTSSVLQKATAHLTVGEFQQMTCRVDENSELSDGVSDVTAVDLPPSEQYQTVMASLSRCITTVHNSASTPLPPGLHSDEGRVFDHLMRVCYECAANNPPQVSLSTSLPLADHSLLKRSALVTDLNGRSWTRELSDIMSMPAHEMQLCVAITGRWHSRTSRWAQQLMESWQNRKPSSSWVLRDMLTAAAPHSRFTYLCNAPTTFTVSLTLGSEDDLGHGQYFSRWRHAVPCNDCVDLSVSGVLVDTTCVSLLVDSLHVEHMNRGATETAPFALMPIAVNGSIEVVDSLHRVPAMVELGNLLADWIVTLNSSSRTSGNDEQNNDQDPRRDTPSGVLWESIVEYCDGTLGGMYEALVIPFKTPQILHGRIGFR